jgi:hypothetical protein
VAPDGIGSLGCRAVYQLAAEERARLWESVLFRIERGDHKGRPFGTPRNPRAPTLEEFNPQIGELNAGDIEGRIGGRKHGLFPEQEERMRTCSTDDLICFRPNDPISGHAGSGTFTITGGHHRLYEIIRRVKLGEIPADTPIRILLHD